LVIVRHPLGEAEKVEGTRKVFIGAEIAAVEDFNRAISAASRARPDQEMINRSVREEKQ
jgi:hypothetical protein